MLEGIFNSSLLSYCWTGAIRNTRKLTILLLLWLAFVRGASAQSLPVSISYPSSAQDIGRQLGSSNLTVKLFFNAACTGTTQVKIALPVSVSYIASSVFKVSGTSGLSVTESSISDLRNPVFAIGGTIAAGDEIVLRISRRAACGSLSTGKDSIYVTTGGACSNSSELLGTINTYNFLTPSLSVVAPAALTDAVVDTTATRAYSIVNGGNGPTDTVRFFIVYPAGSVINTSGTNSITANSVSFSPVRSSGDTLFYKIYGSTIFGGDSLFSGGESISISEPIKVLACSSTTRYGVAWGKSDADICAWNYASSAVVAASGAPNFSQLIATQVGFTDKCTSFSYDMRFFNGGSGKKKVGAFYDIKIQQGHWASSVTVLANMDTSLFAISNFRIGTSTIGFTYVGGIIHINLKDLLTSDPDSTGLGLEDIDGDGYYDDLGPGQSFKLTADIALKCSRNCGQNNYNYSVAAIMQYRTMCSAALQTSDVKLSTVNTLYQYEAGFYGKSYMPANVVGGVPFRLQLVAAFSVNQDSYSSTNTRYRWKFVLPPGFSVSGTGSPRYGTTSVSYSLSGDTVIYTSSSNTLDSFGINLVYSCGSPGAKTISYTLEKINNIISSCKCQGDLLCSSLSTYAFCPVPCPSGPVTYVPRVRRTDSCVGYTDYTCRTRVNPLFISDYDLSKALYLDTIQIFGSAKQNDLTTNLYLNFTLAKTTISPVGVSKLTPQNMEIRIFRSGAPLAICSGITPSTAGSTGSMQSLTYDFSSCIMAMGGLNPGDSIAVVGTYVVSTNNNLPKNDVQSGNGWYFYNLDIMGNEQSCNTTVPEMYLVGTDLVNATNPYITGGCAGTTLGGNSNYLARRFNTAGDNYRSEFRPVMYVDSVVMLMPSGYVWNYAHYSPVAGPIRSFLTPSSVVGNQYTFVNDGSWAALGLTVTNAYGGYFPVNVSPLCGTLASESINFKFYIRDYYYAYANKTTPTGFAYVLGGSAGQTRSIAYTASQKPDLELIDLTGTVFAVKDSLSWNFRLYNKGLNAANYSWFAIPDNAAFEVLKVSEVATGSVVTPISYGAGKWYKLGASGIGAGATKDYKIDVVYKSCANDSLEVFAGWNCGSYPSDPTTYPCSYILDRVAMKVNAAPSQVQLSVLRQPGGGSTVDLCKKDSIILTLNSAQTSNLIEPYLEIYPPLGFTLLSPVKVEYPLGSGDVQNALVTTIPGGGFKIDLTAHTAIGKKGILGTALSSASYSPLGGDRKARVKLEYNTDCDLTSGYSFLVYGFGERPCGDPATGNGQGTTTSAINLTGATTGGIAGATLSLSTASLSCGVSNLVNLTTTPTGVPTQYGDTMIYVLPKEVAFDSSFATGTNCDSCTMSVAAGSAGTTVVKVKLQTGISSGSAMAHSFKIKSKGPGCSSFTINSYFKRNITALTCDTILCSNSSILLATSTSAPISVNKPSLKILDYRLMDTSSWKTGTGVNRILLKYTNIGSAAYVANTDTAELFCGASTTPFATLPLSRSLATGATDSEYYFITVPSSACSVGDLVSTTAKIRTITASGTAQCICDSSKMQLNLMPTVVTPVSYCQGATASALVAYGTTLRWYSVASGGIGSATPIVPATTTPGVYYYYVSQISSTGVESARARITVTIYRTPDKPTVSTAPAYCQYSTASVLSATKPLSTDTLLWYTAVGATPSYTAITPATSVADTLIYYVSAKSNQGCEGEKESIEVIIHPQPAKPVVVPVISLCQYASPDSLSATPVNLADTLLWYSSASGGIPSLFRPLPSTATVGTQKFWVSAKSEFGCEGPRDSIVVTVYALPAKPVVASPLKYCQNDLAAALTASKSAPTDTLFWFTAALGGTPSYTAPTPGTSTEGTTTYWVASKSAQGCWSERDSIQVVVNRLPGMPRVTSPVHFCQFDTAVALTATPLVSGDSLIWYNTASGGSPIGKPIPSTSTDGTISYWVAARTSDGCEGRRAEIEVVVHRKPELPTISSPVYLCQGESAAPLDAYSSGSDSVLWYSSLGSTSGSLTAPTPSTVTAGVSKYYVGLKSEFGCLGDKDSIEVVVSPTPAKPTVVSPVVYCQGTTASALTATKPLSSDTLLWYSSASGGTGSSTAPVPSTSTVGSTVYWVSAKSSLNCEGPRDSIVVQVNRTPGKPTVVTPVVYCQETTASALTATKPLSSDTLLWYSSASGGTGSSTAPIPSTSTAGNTVYWVSAKSSQNCEGPRDSILVQVNRTPAKPTVVTPVVYCQGTTASALTATKPLFSDTLLWYSTATGSAGSTSAPVPSTATVGSTVYWVSAKSSQNCEGPRDSIVVQVNRTPVKPTVVSPAVYCQGTTASALTATKPLSSDTLLWYTSASGGTGSSTAPVPSTATVGSTVYWVSAKSSLNCEGPRDSIVVQVNRTPAKPTVVSPVVYCQGTTASALTATKPLFSDTLLWYSTATGGTGSTSAPVPSTATVGSTVYWVSAKSSLSCEGLRDSIVVKVNRTPAKPTVASPVLYCQFVPTTPLAAMKSDPSDTLLWYSGPSGGIGSSAVPTPSSSVPGIFRYWVGVKSSDNCESVRDTIVVVVNATPSEPLVTSPVVYCQGVATIPLEAFKTYYTDTLLWYSTITGGTASYSTPTPSSAVAGTQYYYVSLKTAPNCEGPRSLIEVQINRTPVKPTVVSPVVYCQGTTASALTATKPLSSDTLLWYSSASGGIGSSTAPVPSTTTVGSTVYWVSAKSSQNCEGPRDSIVVQVNRTPAKPIVVTPVVYCQGTTASALTATKPLSSDTLLWYSTATGSAGSTSAPVPSTATVGSTVYWVSAKSSLNCEGPRDSIVVQVNRTPAKPTVVTPVVYCQGTTASALTATKPLFSDTLLWYSTATGGTGSTSAPVPSTATVGSTVYWVSAKSSQNCEGPRDSIVVQVNPTPLAPVVTTPVVYCQFSVTVPLVAVKPSATDTLNWYTTSTGGIRSLTTPTPGSAVSGTTQYYVSVKNAYGCEGPRSLITVTINPLPSPPIVSTPLVYCQEDSAAALSATGALLLWYSDSTGGVGSTTAPVPSTDSAGTFRFYVSQTNAATGCESKRALIIVTVNPLPEKPTVVSPLHMCLGDGSAAIGAVGINLKWYTVPTGGIASTTAPVATAATIGTTDYYVTQTSLKGCESHRAYMQVIVHDLPTVTISSLSPSGFVRCRKQALILKATPSRISSFQWLYARDTVPGAIYDTVLADSPGIWAVRIRDSFGCKASDSVRVWRDTSIIPTLSPEWVYKCKESTVMLTAHPGYTKYKFELYRNDVHILPGTDYGNIKSVTDTGYYYVRVTTDIGCIDTTNPSTVYQYPIPAKPPITRKGSVLETVSGYRYYYWYRNDRPIIGAHGVSYTFSVGGRYFVEVTDSNGCVNQSDTMLIENTSSIGQSVVQGVIKIYPNPSSGRVFVESPIPVRVSVLDALGKVVIAPAKATEVDLGAFADGVYLIRIWDEDGNVLVNERISKVTFGM